MTFQKNLLALGLCSLVAACGKSGVQGPKANAERAITPYLSESHAAFRASMIQDVSYVMDIQLPKDATSFSGTVAASFTLGKVKDGLTMDFQGGKIRAFQVNGEAVEAKYNGQFIELPTANLQKGKNTVEVSYSHPYSDDGSGLYRFKDPEDGRIYLYTDFEPFDANRLFPCFDQPDLKATYTLTVDAPKKWIVVSAERETGIKELKTGYRRWSFPQTKPFSTYLISLHAGDYKVWEEKGYKTPLRLMSRQSLAKFVEPEFWFTITRQGFDYFNDYFAFDYPFGKYDQVIVPDFNAGAMENVAAVTFSERRISRGSYTRQDRLSIASVILHEMAHMWFGNLVTMQWWNDLWLNESFATYMEAVALYNATEFKESWMDFFDGMKTWAYAEDGMVTTHPIETKVSDTAQAFANFDGISYGKGASTLKQLAYFVGPKNFRNGTRMYFKKHAYQNTRLQDFIGAMEDASDTSLKKWTQVWLRKSGTNSVEAKFACADDKIDSFRLLQSASKEHSTLRPHKMKVGLYSKTLQGQMKAIYEGPVTYAGSETKVGKFQGKTCPDFVFLNLDDHDFVKVNFDEATLEYVKANLTSMKDPFHRRFFWQTLWEMVKDQRLSVQAYAKLALMHLPKESNPINAESVLYSLVGPRWNPEQSVLNYMPQVTPEEVAKRKAFVSDVEKVVWNVMRNVSKDKDLQKTFFRGYVAAAESREAELRLGGLLSGRVKVPGLTLDQDQRWSVIWKLNSMNAKNGEALVVRELKRDKSSKAVKASLAARAARPDIKNKRTWYARVTEKGQLSSLAERKTVMRSLFPVSQLEFKSAFEDQIYQDILKISDAGEEEMVEYFSRWVHPAQCAQESISKLNQFIEDHKSGVSSVALKQLRKAGQNASRCLAIRSFARKN